MLAIQLDHGAVAVDGRQTDVPALLGQAPIVDLLGDRCTHHVDELAEVALGRSSGLAQGGVHRHPSAQAAAGRQRCNELSPVHEGLTRPRRSASGRLW